MPWGIVNLQLCVKENGESRIQPRRQVFQHYGAEDKRPNFVVVHPSGCVKHHEASQLVYMDGWMDGWMGGEGVQSGQFCTNVIYAQLKHISLW